MSFNFMAESPSAVILEDKKIKSVSVSIDSPSIRHEVMGPDAMILAQHDRSTTVGKFLGSSAFFMIKVFTSIHD